ncbi:N-acetylmuramoyl-L-alanine amidase-like domain-containing protein [Persicitalea jodogahamensis]|uniref:Xylanase n=1 Tax=Persicitalea jodogahamensis TaxID=402147 RepID=A0A8J3GBG8_9BACT|nr:N-acetylmuramoyl-L-alanine amidase-like domain-containing protein [Persicitalea jodogahamensis]GHB81533.1 xylanase [Persicitalea jodogahamensis]
MAETFLGTPYVAHTLEGNASEQLVCRFDALDCTTLVDVSVALALAKKEELDYNNFLDKMVQLRYDGGKIDGYSSRQHYFLSWRNQGQQTGLLEDITKTLGGVPYKKEINFMSAHADLYKGIDSKEVLEKIKVNERRVNAESYYFVPKENVKNVEANLHDGDIIGITSTIPGLDCNHQGIVKMTKGRAHLVHASTTAKKVISSNVPLSDYLNSVKRHSGVIVLRLKEKGNN